MQIGGGVGNVNKRSGIPPFRQTSMSLALQASLVPQRAVGSSTPTFTRNLAAYQTDFEGKLNATLANEARFNGSRRIYNEYVGSASLSTQGVTVIAGTYAVSFTGTGTITFSGANVGSLVGQGANVTVGAVITTTAGTLTSTVTGTVTNAMLENQTGRTNTNPSDIYVDSATAYGANVNGVAYSSFLNASTISSGTLTRLTGPAINSSTAKFGVLPGSGNAVDYFSTPSSSAVNALSQKAGVIDFVTAFTINSTPVGVAQFVVAKDNSGGSSRVFNFGIQHVTGKLYSELYQTDGTAVTITSTGAWPYLNGTFAFARMKLNIVLGGTSTVDFYSSLDGVTWTPFGSQQTTAIFTTGLQAGTNLLTVGGRQYAANQQILNGRVYRVKIYNGDSTVGGTLAVDFNPNDSTSAQTWASATTGETWTTNGNARVFGNTNATYGIPAPWDAGGPLGYLAEGSRQNLALQSNSFNTTWTKLGTTPTVVQNALAPDGTTTGWTITDVAADLEYIQQIITVASDTTTYTISFYVLKTFGAATFPGMGMFFTPGTGITAMATLNTDTGAITARDANTAGVTISSVAVNSSFWRVAITVANNNSGNTSLGFLYAPAVNSNAGAAWVNATTGSSVLAWVQLEAASFPSTYIPTTTTAVTRPADVLTYPTAGNISGTQGTAYAEVTISTLPSTSAGYFIEGNSAGGGNRPLIYYSGSSGTLNIYDGTTVVGALAFTPSLSTVKKIASVWGGASMNVASNGVLGTSGSFDGDINLGTNFEIGSGNSDTAQIFGTIRNVRIYSRALPAATLQQITT